MSYMFFLLDITHVTSRHIYCSELRTRFYAIIAVGSPHSDPAKVLLCLRKRCAFCLVLFDRVYAILAQDMPQIFGLIFFNLFLDLRRDVLLVFV